MLPSPLFSAPVPSAALPAARTWLQPAPTTHVVVRQRHSCSTCRLNFDSSEDLEAHVEDHIPVSQSEPFSSGSAKS